MNNFLLICDSSSSFSTTLTGSFRSRNADSLLIVPAVEIGEELPPASIAWNRSSALSARTVVVSLKNRTTGPGTVIFILDGPELARSFVSNSLDSSAALLEDYIRGQFLLVSSLYTHLYSLNAGRVVFVCRPCDTLAGSWPASMIEASFTRLAEKVAADVASRKNTSFQTMLVRLEEEDDVENAEWLADRLLSGSVERGGTRWIKAGSRSLFSKF